ncbi:MAG: hypothetical protein KDK11_15710, partial [Maritimibacter sp.]|nr:hypothetical protein [Maritimibacter sp.]
TGGELPPECVGVDPGTDPRPADTGLDDFGGQPTDVLCAPRAVEEEPAMADEAPAMADETMPEEAAPTADDAGAGDTGLTTNPAGDQNSAITN